MFLALFILSGLSACGGGGSGGNTPAVVPTNPAPAPPDPPDPPDPNPEPAAFTVSGTVKILASSAIDSDTNDVNAPNENNNSFDNAQPLNNPVTLGGHVNQPGSGPEGQTQSAGDIEDFFRIDFAGGENIVLSFATPTRRADLDLALYDEARNLVDASIDANSSTETLSVPAAGTYFIEVEAFSGASNYVLSIGQLDIASLQRPVRLSDSFVPNEFLVMLDETQAAGTRLPLAMDMKQRAGDIMLLRGTPLSQAQSKTQVAAIGSHQHRAMQQALPEHLQARYETLLQLKRLQQDPAVACAEANLMRKPSRIPGDEFFDIQWHYNAINLPQAWDITTGDASVVVAVIDTGIVANHPDFSGKLVSGYDFISNASSAGDGDGIDPNPNDEGDEGFGESSSFHGTHVAGTVGAATDNTAPGQADGVAAAGWDTRVMPIRALGRDGGTSMDIIQSIRFAAGLSNDSGTLPSAPAAVINMSFGGTVFSQAEQSAIDAARANGSILVAAAGNESSSAPSYPASYEGVISVSATTITDALAGYSNFGPTIDIAAPGGNGDSDLNGDGFFDGVASTIADDSDASEPLNVGYGLQVGTSMAAPHVAAVIALMQAVVPTPLSPDDIDGLLATGQLTDDLGATGRDDQYGNGLINALKAVTAAQSGGIPTPLLTASASTLNFGNFQTTLNVTVRNGGTGGTLTVTSVSTTTNEGSGWLTIDPGGPLANGLGDYTISVDRAGLTDGIYTGSVNFTSSANSLSVVILMQVSSLSTTADAGLHYVVLADANTKETLPNGEIRVSANNGEYPFEFSDIPAGDYVLAAGTDIDNDGFLCDSGEACGFYLTLDAPSIINVEDNDRSGLDFLTSFLADLDLSGNGATVEVLQRRPAPVNEDKSPQKTVQTNAE